MVGVVPVPPSASRSCTCTCVLCTVRGLALSVSGVLALA